MSRAGRAARALRSPALHFAAIGAALFALAGGPARVALGPAPEATPIVVRAEQIERIVDAYQRASGLRASDADVRALVEQEIDGEVLHREALARGLDRTDRGVQWRLVEKMSFLADGHDEAQGELLGQAQGLGLGDDDLIVRRILIEKMRLQLRHEASTRTPEDAELEAWMQAHPRDFVLPARVRITHVFVARDRHGAGTEAEAARLRERLPAGNVAPEAAARLGDPFPLDRVAGSQTERDLATRFGAAFASSVASLAPGAWSEPIASTYGLHLVWVHEHTPERTATLAEARGRALYGLMAERRAQSLAQRLRELRERYTIDVEWPAPRVAGAPGDDAGSRP